jgi:predicted transcriptional regulator
LRKSKILKNFGGTILANDTQVQHRSNAKHQGSDKQVKEKQLTAEKINQNTDEKRKHNRKVNKTQETPKQQTAAEKENPDDKQKTAGNLKKSNRSGDKPQQKSSGSKAQSQKSEIAQQNGGENQQSRKNNGTPKMAESHNSNGQHKTPESKKNNGQHKTPESKKNNGQHKTTESKNSTENRNQSNNTGDNRKQAHAPDPKSDQGRANQSKQNKTVQNKNQENNNPKANSENTNQEHEVNHKEQSGKFETAFNRIHKALRDMVKETDSDAFVELLYSGYKNHSLIRKYKSELHQFAKLRNAIVHERVNADYYIAEPHIEVVERIEEICREFEKPQTALSIATSPVFYYYEDAYLKDVLKVINKFDFTRFPVYDKDDKYVALLTSTEIIQWMAKHFSSEVIHFEDVRIKDLLTNGKNYFVTFVKEEASLYEIEELFERYHTRGKKLQAVIITETGDRHGTPIGVITPWDLLDSEPSED